MFSFPKEAGEKPPLVRVYDEWSFSTGAKRIEKPPLFVPHPNANPAGKALHFTSAWFLLAHPPKPRAHRHVV